MMRKGRQRVPRGVDATSVKLTEAQVREVRVAGGLQREIAAAYGISQMQVSRIKRGVRWRHLFEETSDG
jgi:DNA invertase Pin-like site-specific DNA recombinase